MPRSKWAKPCEICKGVSKYKCMICGWKKEKIRLRDFPPGERAKIEGVRERARFFHDLDGSITRSDNHTVGPIVIDEETKALAEKAIPIDAEVTKHREFAIRLMKMHIEKHMSYKEIAEEFQLTTSLVAKIIQLAKDKTYRGIMQVDLNPRSYAISELNVFLQSVPVRKTMNFEEIEGCQCHYDCGSNCDGSCGCKVCQEKNHGAV